MYLSIALITFIATGLLSSVFLWQKKTFPNVPVPANLSIMSKYIKNIQLSPISDPLRIIIWPSLSSLPLSLFEVCDFLLCLWRWERDLDNESLNLI